MSYSRTYRRSISMSGSVRVDYPASEKGGTTTAYWEHTEPVEIEIEVDTSPFDESVESCKNHVDVLGGAVGVMSAAQCVAIRESAKKISASLQNGFFGAVRTELGQQMADLRSRFEAKLGLLMQQAQSSKRSLETMQRDFQRIVAQYQDLFRNMDEECMRRVTALDRPAFRLAGEAGRVLLTEGRLSMAAPSVTISREIGEAQSLLVASRLRKRALGMLESAKDHLMQERAVAESMKESLLEREAGERKEIRLPVLVMVADGEPGAPEATVVAPPRFGLGESGMVKAAVGRGLDEAAGIEWIPMAASVRARLERDYMRCVDEAFGTSNPRTAAVMGRLWESTATCRVVAPAKENT